ncbi:MAG: FecR domain-containing protein [Elusimicrobia bacterium]|nr:FecR domain-containing protein [Elusimicrobiota bacterium]
MRTLALLLASVLGAGPAWADAVLRRVSGPVSIKALGHRSFVPADPGAGLIEGDTLKTGPGGVAQLEFDGGAILLVTGGSTFVLGGEPGDPIVEFKLGEWLLGLTRKLGRGRRFRVSTPQAVAAVRGTLFWGQTGPRETLLAGLEQTVEITAQGKTVALGPGQLVKVPSGKPPEKPVPHSVPAPFLDRFKVDGSLAGIEPLLKPRR